MKIYTLFLLTVLTSKAIAGCDDVDEDENDDDHTQCERNS